MTARESAKESIRFWGDQQKHAENRYKAKEIDKEEYLRIHRKYALMTEAVQQVFRKAD
jgi:hypothetical protein